MAEEAEAEQSTTQTAPFLSQSNTVEYSPEQFAKSLVDFYNALIKAGITNAFAEKLTIALCQRP